MFPRRPIIFILPFISFLGLPISYFGRRVLCSISSHLSSITASYTPSTFTHTHTWRSCPSNSNYSSIQCIQSAILSPFFNCYVIAVRNYFWPFALSDKKWRLNLNPQARRKVAGHELLDKALVILLWGSNRLRLTLFCKPLRISRLPSNFKFNGM